MYKGKFKFSLLLFWFFGPGDYRQENIFHKCCTNWKSGILIIGAYLEIAWLLFFCVTFQINGVNDFLLFFQSLRVGFCLSLSNAYSAGFFLKEGFCSSPWVSLRSRTFLLVPKWFSLLSKIHPPGPETWSSPIIFLLALIIVQFYILHVI